MVVLVICRCVNTTETKMELAHLVKKMGVKLTQVWDAKLDWDCLLLLTLGAMYTSRCANVDGYFRQGRWCQHNTT